MRTVVIPAGGLGRRLHPLTHAVPKALLPVGRLPMIDHALREAAEAGFARAKVLVSSDVSNAVGRHCASAGTGDRRDLAVEVVDVPWRLGLGYGLWAARDLVGDEQVGVLLPDEIVTEPGQLWRRMWAAADRFHASSVGVWSPQGGGSELFRVGSLAEVPSEGLTAGGGTARAMIGRYVVTPAAFGTLGELVTGAAPDDEVSLTQVLQAHAARDVVVGVRHEGSYWDAGSIEGYVSAFTAFAGTAT
jgi:UTP--glucose-1-phosphate uridylyltransferase